MRWKGQEGWESRTKRLGEEEGRVEKQQNKKMGEIKKMIKGKFKTQIKTRIIQTKKSQSKDGGKICLKIKIKSSSKCQQKKHKWTMAQACVIMNQDGYP